ncbi:hypothetical protein K7X08_023648 [Anisodus acutangulus]|uniref:Pentatricopeptide repeat-containing protein n=1 Tax=Anisodus acutangulus TaxID=402998 RepID=A0A9Q1LA28_9SOLA|nr:hypothetical protein K7X08_023648 [Anisodus acutangulus]
MSTRAISRLKIPSHTSLFLLKHLSVSRIPSISSNFTLRSPEFSRIPSRDVRFYHDGRPRGPLWRGKKLIGKEALFVILGLKRFKDDEEKVDKFVKTHVLRLLKMDMITVLNELERQEEVSHAVKVFWVIQKQAWYQPDVYLYKDLIIALARRRKMDDAMKLWERLSKTLRRFFQNGIYMILQKRFLDYVEALIKPSYTSYLCCCRETSIYPVVGSFFHLDILYIVYKHYY